VGELPVTRREDHPVDGSRDEEPVLPDTTSDEREVGWGDEPSRRADEWYERERPPHHE
jgi:hypothetical protein